MEIEILIEQANKKWKFQENLVVWKYSYRGGRTEAFYIVSGELSSMEMMKAMLG